MAKKVKRIKVKKEKEPVKNNDMMDFRQMIYNTIISRSNLIQSTTDPRRNIDYECGYPELISIEEYKTMYDREAVAERVVNLMPQESWGTDPQVIEDDAPEETEFETRWKEIEKELNLFSYMYKVDELSGIGQFGLLLFGLNDNKELSEPVEGINEDGDKVGNQEYEVLFVRAFDQSVITVKSIQTDVRSKRYGKPTLYSVKFKDMVADKGIKKENNTGKEVLIHWTRVIHIADNLRTSEVYGTPRMQVVYNRLLDIQKITGGSAEMFWKGGFPGYSFEMDPNAQTPTTAELDALKTEIDNYSNGLQRYLVSQGLKVNSLTSNITDPKAHIEVQLTLIAIELGVPKRIFMGTEQAKLASSTDSENWNKRVKRRREKYVTPNIIKATIDRLIAFGTLPEPENINVIWPDLDAPSDLDKAEVLKTVVEALSKYVAGGVDQLIPPEIFLKMYMDLSEDEINEIMKAVDQYIDEMEEENRELMEGEEEEENVPAEEEDQE